MAWFHLLSNMSSEACFAGDYLLTIGIILEISSKYQSHTQNQIYFPHSCKSPAYLNHCHCLAQMYF